VPHRAQVQVLGFSVFLSFLFSIPSSSYHGRPCLSIRFSRGPSPLPAFPETRCEINRFIDLPTYDSLPFAEFFSSALVVGVLLGARV